MSILWHIPPLLCDAQPSYHSNQQQELEVLGVVICINLVILFQCTKKTKSLQMLITVTDLGVKPSNG